MSVSPNPSLFYNSPAHSVPPHLPTSTSPPDAPVETIPAPPLALPAYKYTLEELVIYRIIARGGHGTVKLALDTTRERTVAVKEISKARLCGTKNVLRAFREKVILAEMKHSGIVELYGSLQDEQRLYLVMEYIRGKDLLSVLTDTGKLTAGKALFCAVEITAVLLYLHGQGVVYRDLKPENVMVTREGHIKLVDFGSAKRLKFSELTFTLCGTPEYLSPEILQRNGHSFAVDWWTLGVLVHELLTGKTPFLAETPTQTYINILTQTYVPPPHLDEPTQSLLAGLLSKDAGLRLTGDSVRAHRYFSGVDWEQLHLLSPPFTPQSLIETGDYDSALLKDAFDAEEMVGNQDVFQDF